MGYTAKCLCKYTFSQNLIFVSKAVKHLSDAPLLGRLLALPVSIRPKGLPGTKNLACFPLCQSLRSLDPVPDKAGNKLDFFVTNKSFQLGLNTDG